MYQKYLSWIQYRYEEINWTPVNMTWYPPLSQGYVSRFPEYLLKVRGMCQGFQIPTQGLTPLPYFHDLTTDPNQGCCPPNNTAIFPTPDPGPKPKAKGFTHLTPLISWPWPQTPTKIQGFQPPNTTAIFPSPDRDPNQKPSVSPT